MGDDRMTESAGPDPSPKLKTGDRVRLTFECRTVDAVVVLASPNGRSLALSFDALLGGYVGMMPVLWESGHYRDLITKQIASVEERQ